MTVAQRIEEIPPASTPLAAPTSLPSVAYAPAVVPPTDDEVYAYLGPQQRWIQLLMTAAFAATAVSLGLFALHSWWFIPLLVVLGVNIVGTALALVSGLNRRRITATGHRALVRRSTSALRPNEAPTVDVFLPCCGEDLTVLRTTYENVARMSWPGSLRVYVLDDGASDDVGELAAEFGFDYIVRPDRGHLKKAGNLRHAFTVSEGDFIVILDADFSPRHDFLFHTIPYLADPSVAIVQTPQYFATTADMSWLQRTAGATQELFYRWVQPSRDRADAAICVGTCAVYRRSAIAEIGGFAPIEHSEDIHTGILLTRAGYVLRYVPAVVSRGLCPDDLPGFLNQQYRWCMGSLTRLDTGGGPGRRLTLRQRVSFAAGILYYVSTALNVFATALPGPLMAVVFPDAVRAVDFVPLLAALWVYIVVMPRVSRSQWRIEVLRVQMAYSFSHAVALVHKITGHEAGWVPTGAVRRRNHLARTISLVGAITLGIVVVGSWFALGSAIVTHGLQEFWPLTIFIAGYTYLAVPLVWGFITVIAPRVREPRVAASRGTSRGPMRTVGVSVHEPERLPA